MSPVPRRPLPFRAPRTGYTGGRAASRQAAALGATVLLAACFDDDRRTAPTSPAGAPAASLAPSAPAATGTALAFLAPLGPARAGYHGAFDAGRAPVVEVCRWTGAACAGAPVARYTLTSGTGGEPLRVVADQQHYRADWKARDRPAGAVYRVRVLLDGGALGAADVRVLRPGETEAQVVADGYTPVSQSQNLIVRFRVETSADYLPGDADAPAAAAVPRRDLAVRGTDFSAGHPALGQVPVSPTTLAVAFARTATVAEVNHLLAEIGATVVGGIPGRAGESSGVLALRLAAGTHVEMEAVLARLRADARVAAAAQDVAVGDDFVPHSPDGNWWWTWDVTPAGGNWGLEAIRAPQLWNLNGGVRKALAQGGLLPPIVGVLDGGTAAHDDLPLEANLTPAVVSRHGTHVAGIIGARFDNGQGSDGVTPFVRLVAQGVRVATGGAALEHRGASGLLMVWDFERLVRAYPAMRVVNASQGYNWVKYDIANDDPAAARIAREQGLMLREVLRTLAADHGQLPVVTASAGNASDGAFGVQDAVNSSPFTSAALRHAAAPVVVVEATRRAGPGVFERAAFSNVGGHVAAPGEAVFSTDSIPGQWVEQSGTSQAAPHVAGLVAYLYALDPALPPPTMTSNPALDVLRATGRAVTGTAAPQVHAFDAALALDARAATPTTAVLRKLVDIDDGTLDGNTRTNADGSDYLETDADGDRGRGDGRVDMSDFRRWRDLLLAVERAGGGAPALDGSVRHPKRDVNGNRRWAADGDDEAVSPLGDFNGDGLISRTLARPVPGAMLGASATDLAVLQRLFDDDPDGAYTKNDLPGLVESGDLTVDASVCLARPGAVRARVRVYPAGDSAHALTRSHDAAAPVRVYTRPATSGGAVYTVAVDAYDAAGEVLASAHDNFTVRLGGDERWTPECDGMRVVILGPTQTSFGVGDTVRVYGWWSPEPPVGFEYNMAIDNTCGALPVPFGNTYWLLVEPTIPGPCRITVRDGRIDNGRDGTRGAASITVNVGGPFIRIAAPLFPQTVAPGGHVNVLTTLGGYPRAGCDPDLGPCPTEPNETREVTGGTLHEATWTLPQTPGVYTLTAYYNKQEAPHITATLTVTVRP